MTWSYHKKSREWYEYTGSGKEMIAWNIKKRYNKYVLTRRYFVTIGSFKKLSSAKKVAELMVNG